MAWLLPERVDALEFQRNSDENGMNNRYLLDTNIVIYYVIPLISERRARKSKSV